MRQTIHHVHPSLRKTVNKVKTLRKRKTEIYIKHVYDFFFFDAATMRWTRIRWRRSWGAGLCRRSRSTIRRVSLSERHTATTNGADEFNTKMIRILIHDISLSSLFHNTNTEASFGFPQRRKRVSHTQGPVPVRIVKHPTGRHFFGFRFRAAIPEIDAVLSLTLLSAFL